MSLSFSIEGMEQLYADAKNYADKFRNAIDSLNTAITELGQVWTSDETGTYEKFKELYDGKKPTLDNAYNEMVKFYTEIENKKNDFSTASNNIINKMG